MQYNLKFLCDVLSEDATGLRITIGQFISATVFLIVTMCGIATFLLRTFGSYTAKVNKSIAEMEKGNALTEQRVKALEDNRAENRQTLGEIKDTLNKVNTKVEVILSKSVIFNQDREDKG